MINGISSQQSREAHRWYDFWFRTVFSRMDPERAHHLVVLGLRFARFARIDVLWSKRLAPSRRLSTTVAGISFPSPFGVAAGFDKDAAVIEPLARLGFGHVEVGTVTPRPQPGNPRPRLFRFVVQGALLNRMGFNNRGASAASERIAHLRGPARARVVVGVNIGKNRTTALDDAESDYEVAAKAVAAVADYLVINVSSPNTPGLRTLQARDRLEPIILAVRRAIDAIGLQPPVFLKISPDMTDAQIREVVELAREVGLAGIVATNTTTQQLAGRGGDGASSPTEGVGPGGVSGAPLAPRSLEVLRLVVDHARGDLAVISVGGVQSASDVIDRLLLGANVVQGFTEFIYSGPLWANEINRGLLAFVEHSGMQTLDDAVSMARRQAT